MFLIFIRYCPQFSADTILINSIPSGFVKMASQILEILIFCMKTTEQTRDTSALLEKWSIYDMIVFILFIFVFVDI